MHLLVRISEKKSRILLIPLGVILEYMWVRAEFCVLWFEQCIILPFAGSSMRRTIAKHWAFLTVSHLQFWICGRTGYMQYIWICPRKLHETLFFVMKKWGYNCTLFSSNFLVDFFLFWKISQRRTQPKSWVIVQVVLLQCSQTQETHQNLKISSINTPTDW